MYLGDLLCSLNANLIRQNAVFQVIAQFCFDPPQTFVAITAVLDHITGHSKEMYLSKSRLAEFKNQELVKDILAGARVQNYGAAFRADIPFSWNGYVFYLKPCLSSDNSCGSDQAAG
jgi:hypothetical protein